LQHDAPKQVKLPFTSANKLYKIIREQFGTIVFCRRYLERLGVDRYLAGVSYFHQPEEVQRLTHV
jgi:methionyl aminopeptidase